jgi:protein disulfide-isomerase
LAVLLCGGVATGIVLADGEHEQVSSSWVASLAEGQRIARREGKDLLVNFAGTDWCIPCRELDEQVFSRPEFLDGADERFVFVTLDFPRNPAAQARVPDAAGNAAAQAKYKVVAFPTVLLMTADGDVYGSTGYRAGGPGKYLEHVLKMVKVNRRQMRAAVELAAAIDDAKPAAVASLRTEAVRALTEFPRDAPYADVLVPAVRAVLDAAAKDDTATRAACLHALLRVRRGAEEDEKAARALDKENKSGLLELAVDAACPCARTDPWRAARARRPLGRGPDSAG